MCVLNDIDDPTCHFHLLDRYFQVMLRRKILLTPKKIVIFTTSLKHNGRVYSAKGILPDLTRSSAVLDSPSPTTLADIYARICTYAYNREFIPNFVQLEYSCRQFVMSTLGTGRKSIQRAKSFRLTAVGRPSSSAISTDCVSPTPRPFFTVRASETW